jgi:hypothetical protein
VIYSFATYEQSFGGRACVVVGFFCKREKTRHLFTVSSLNVEAGLFEIKIRIRDCTHVFTKEISGSHPGLHEHIQVINRLHFI